MITRFIFDNEDILLELDGSNNITTRYTYGPGIDEPLILEKGGASFFYHADGLGSITEITNQSGTVVQSYTYSSFGKIESQLDPNFIQGIKGVVGDKRGRESFLDRTAAFGIEAVYAAAVSPFHRWISLPRAQPSHW